jgi:hypothetical protein
MRLANLNVFLACLVLSYFLLSTPAMLLVMIVTAPLHILEQREHPFWANVNSHSEGT